MTPTFLLQVFYLKRPLLCPCLRSDSWINIYIYCKWLQKFCKFKKTACTSTHCWSTQTWFAGLSGCLLRVRWCCSEREKWHCWGRKHRLQPSRRVLTDSLRCLWLQFLYAGLFFLKTCIYFVPVVCVYVNIQFIMYYWTIGFNNITVTRHPPIALLIPLITTSVVLGPNRCVLRFKMVLDLSASVYPRSKFKAMSPGSRLKNSDFFFFTAPQPEITGRICMLFNRP